MIVILKIICQRSAILIWLCIDFSIDDDVVCEKAHVGAVICNVVDIKYKIILSPGLTPEELQRQQVWG